MQRIVQFAVRVLLGLYFLSGGVGFFFNSPLPSQEDRVLFFHGVELFLQKGAEALCGLMLVTGFYVPLALVVLAPIVLRMVLVRIFFHSLLLSFDLPFSLGVLVATVYLAFFSSSYSPQIKALFLRPGARQ